MASRLEPFDVTIPAGTLQSAPVTIATPFDIAVVESLEILIPPGPSGLMGFQVRHGGSGVLPREDDRWIIADNAHLDWPTSDLPTAGDWAVRGYNEDVFDHTIYIRYLVTEIARVTRVADTPQEIVQPNQVAPEVEDESPPAGEDVV
jgi:hypothetical protein